MTEINFLNIIQVLVAIALIGFILIQRGPGATAGSAFGGGASGTVFGAKGSGSFLTKSTAVLATLFFIITMLIAIDASDQFGAPGAEGQQDLGVFGELEDEASEPGLVPLGDDAEGAALDQAVNDAINATNETVNDAAEVVGDSVDAVDDTVDDVKQAAGDAVDSVEQQAQEVMEDIDQATESEEDSEGDNNG